jgi:hypothetical protein
MYFFPLESYESGRNSVKGFSEGCSASQLMEPVPRKGLGPILGETWDIEKQLTLMIAITCLYVIQGATSIHSKVSF